MFAAETTEDIYFFDDTLEVNPRMQLGLTGRIAQPFLFVGPGATEGWIGFDYFDAVNPTNHSVDVYELGSMGPQLRVSRAGNSAGTLFLQKNVLTLASFQDTGTLELFDVRDGMPVVQSSMLRGNQPALTVSSAQSNPAYVAWQEGVGARRTIAAAVVTDTGATANSASLVYPRSPVLQREVKVSFREEKGIAVWEIGNDVAQFVWVEHTPGTNRLELGASLSLFGGPSPGELTGEQAVAMGRNGALVLTRYRNNGASILQPFFVARNDNSITQLTPVAGELPAVAFDGTNFQVMWVTANGLQLAEYADSESSVPAMQPLPGVRPLGFDFDCRAPLKCLVGLERNTGGLGWMFSDQAGPSGVDMLATQGPIAVTSDSDRFYLAWKHPSMARLTVNSVARGDVGLSLVGAFDVTNSLVTIQAARGTPPWLAVGNVEGDIYVARASPGARFAKMTSGRSMDLTSLDTEERLAVLGFTAFDSTSGSMLPHVVLLREAFDAGTDGGADGGGGIPQPDGGLDAGEGDDAGVQARFDLRSQSCGCDASSGGLIALALLIMSRKR